MKLPPTSNGHSGVRPWRLITWLISRMKCVDSNWILTLCLFRLLAVAKAICIANLTILPSVPYICVDMAAAILSVPAIEFGLVGDRALLIETEICADVAIRGYFILMPEQESYYKILSELGLSL